MVSNDYQRVWIAPRWVDRLKSIKAELIAKPWTFWLFHPSRFRDHVLETLSVLSMILNQRDAP